jgi:hypothetical protein
MKKLIIVAQLLLFVCIQLHAQSKYDWLQNTPSSTTSVPTYTPDYNFIEQMANKADARIQEMIDAGYYYDNVDARWISPDECKRRYTKLQADIDKMENSKYEISDDGWYTANYYFTNSPIAIVYGGDVYIKKGKLNKLRFNSNLSTKFYSRSTISKNRVSGNVSNKRSGTYYGKNITIYLLSKSDH